jgi:hypothetical protein
MSMLPSRRCRGARIVFGMNIQRDIKPSEHPALDFFTKFLVISFVAESLISLVLCGNIVIFMKVPDLGDGNFKGTWAVVYLLKADLDDFDKDFLGHGKPILKYVEAQSK